MIVKLLPKELLLERNFHLLPFWLNFLHLVGFTQLTSPLLVANLLGLLVIQLFTFWNALVKITNSNLLNAEDWYVNPLLVFRNSF